MRFLSIIAATLAVGAALAPAVASGSLVSNGSFEVLTSGLGQLGYNANAVGWTTTGYNFVFVGSNGDSVGSNGAYSNLKLWRPANGSANGLGPSPYGGNYVGADGAFGVAPIQQVLTGLTAGKRYAIAFSWGGIQQNGFNGTQTEQWEVSLGGAPAQFTSIYNNPNHGFSGWINEKFIFVADGTSATLSFLAHGTPNGVPPFSLLDGVSGGAVPEPASRTLMIGGLGLVGAALRFRRRGPATVAA
jgi:hypothetical protein